MEYIWKILKTLSFKRSDKCVEQYGTILPSEGGVVNFDRGKSLALCYGIDRQYHYRYTNECLGETVKNDVNAIGKALSINMNLNSVQVFTSSSESNDCTKDGIKNRFIKSAKKVEKGGIFVFYFAGHGGLIENKYILAPADFAGSNNLDSGISGDELIEWLHKASCKASHVLFIFDCCYAGHLGRTLTFDNKQNIEPSLFVMCACAAGEICTSFDALGHSCFTYFLVDYLKTNNITGQFDVKQAMNEITELCSSFSSLMVMYNQEEGELENMEMNPKLYPQNAERRLPVTPENDLIIFLLQQCVGQGITESPHPKVEEWLKSTNVKKSLDVLYTKAFSCKALQKGIVSAMFYSSCSIQLANEKSSLNKRNLFLTIAIKVSHAINFGNLTKDYLILGLEQYTLAIKGDIDKKDLWLLYEQITESGSHVPNEDGGRLRGHMQDKEVSIPQHCKQSSWSPLII